MAKIKNPFFGFGASGSIARALSFRRRFNHVIAEKIPIPKDAKTAAQLSWRAMYLKAVALWHALSTAEKSDWEILGTAKHMTGFAFFMSQCLKPNPGIYLPLIGGTMQGNVIMDTNKITALPQPTSDQEPATKKYVDDLPGGTTTKIIDADEDTSLDVEKNADEDKIRGTVKGVESFLLSDDGILDLVKQSSCRAYRSTSSQVIANNTWTKVQLNAEDWDIQSEFDSTTNYRFTAKKAGIYIVSCNLYYLTPATGKRYIISLRKNGAEEAVSSFHSSSNTHFHIHGAYIVSLSASQYLELYTQHNAGVNKTIYHGRTTTFMAIHKLA